MHCLVWVRGSVPWSLASCAPACFGSARPLRTPHVFTRARLSRVSTQLAGRPVLTLRRAWRPSSRPSEECPSGMHCPLMIASTALTSTAVRAPTVDTRLLQVVAYPRSCFWEQVLDEPNKERVPCRSVLVTLVRQVCMIAGVAA